MCSTMVGGGWWRLVAVGGGWWLAVGGGWWLAVGGGWRLAVGNWRLVAVGGGWRRLVAGGWWRLVVGGWWRLAVDGSWRLAVGGPLGRSLRAVLSKKKKKSRPLRTPLRRAGDMRRACTQWKAVSAKDKMDSPERPVHAAMEPMSTNSRGGSHVF